MSKRGLLILIIVISLLVMACSCNVGNYFNNLLNAIEEAMSDEISEIAEEVILDVEPLNEEVVLEANPQPEVEVEDELEEIIVPIPGPVMVIHTLNQILVMDDDGLKMKEIYSGAFIQQVAASPNNKMAAFLTSELEHGDGKLNLYILDLKTKQVKLITPLTNDQTTLYNAEQTGDLDFEARDANIAISWSIRYGVVTDR